MKVAVSGHRPPGIGGYETPNPTEQWVRATINKTLASLVERQGAITGITGMALGVDLIYAEECHRLGIPFIAALPFKGQENRWPDRSQILYRTMLKAAAEVVIVDELPEYHSDQFAKKMILRNVWMVDQAEMVIAVWNGTGGGTAHAVETARRKHRKTILLDPRTQQVSILKPEPKPKKGPDVFDIFGE